MTANVLAKLPSLSCTVGLGSTAARLRWLGKPEDGDPARVLGNLAFYLFVRFGWASWPGGADRVTPTHTQLYAAKTDKRTT
jgi:hypothetical protein